MYYISGEFTKNLKTLSFSKMIESLYSTTASDFILSHALCVKELFQVVVYKYSRLSVDHNGRRCNVM